MDVVVIETPSLGDRTYLVHDGSVGLVVDSQRDVDRVMTAAEDAGVRITHVVETHVHNDYVSGGLTLMRLTGATYVHAADEDLSFEHTGVVDGDRFTVGSLVVSVMHTPGHTPHHLSYLVADRSDRSGTTAAFTGGSLLYGSVGRTDLIDESATDELTRAQYRSAQHLADVLADDTRIYPTHGFGSFCSSASSDADSDGTMGGEREVNVAYTAENEDDFVRRLVAGLDSYPRYYAHMGPLNRAGGVAVDLSPPAAVDPVELARRIHRGEWVVDLRSRTDFAAQHVSGTVGIELADGFSTYLAWLLPWGMPVTLLADDADDIADAQRQLVRVGLDRPAGAATGPVDRWAGEADRSTYPVADFGDLAAADGVTVVDVRLSGEHADGHVAGAVSVPLGDLLRRIDELPDGELWVHCASGYRAGIAASLLDRAGRSVVVVDDDWANAADRGVSVSTAD